MPRRKSGIGRQPGDDFGKIRKQPDVDTYRQSSRWSFRAPAPKPDLTKLDDACGFEDIHITQNLLDKRGRKDGEIVLYDPVQEQNYLSQAARYEAAVGLEIHSIGKNEAGRTIYRFCSKRSPTGFWEVTISGATFVRIINPILNIICPRPFKLRDVGSAIETDDESLVWEQLQGRLTIVSPESGNGSLDPTFAILPAARDPLEPPILIRVSLSGDASIGDTLAIRTTATSTVFGIGSNLMDWGQDPCRSVQRVFLLPAVVSQAIAYDGTSSLLVGWLDPTCGAADITGYIWQQNTTGQYVDVQGFTAAEPKKFSLNPSTRYRIITSRVNQNISNSIDSPRFEFSVPIGGKMILADEKQPRVSSTLIDTNFNTNPYTLKRLDNTESYTSGISSTFIDTSYTVTAGGGIVIG
ncbi:MAG TPA: hypothetical protein V6D33_11985 [Cyanophyceae cyanobacterium]